MFRGIGDVKSWSLATPRRGGLKGTFIQPYSLPACFFFFFRVTCPSLSLLLLGELRMMLLVGSGDVQQLFENGFSIVVAVIGANLGGVATSPDAARLRGSVSFLVQTAIFFQGPIGF